MNFNSKRTECSAKSFFMVLILLKIKKIHFISVKDQFGGLIVPDVDAKYVFSMYY